MTSSGRCSPGCRSAGRMARTISASQRNRPDQAARSARAGRGRCTRSPVAQIEPRGAGAEHLLRRSATRPAIEPTTTSSSATNRTLTPSRWHFGSTPLTAGPMNRPAASHAVAIQKMPSWTCHVRATLYGSQLGERECRRSRRPRRRSGR